MKIPIPDNIEKRVNDYVSYTATDQNGKKEEKDHICYAGHMDRLTKYSFELVPYRKIDDWKKWAIDGESYLEFIELFKDNWLIDLSVEAKVDDDGVMKMHIPAGLSRHRVYSAMCAYRWAESLSPFVYLTLKLYKENKDLSFWQILHYVMSTQVSSCGHNWCNVGQTLVSLGHIYSNYGMSYNLGLSLSFPLFWHKTEEELLKLDNMTNYRIDSIAKNIAPCESMPEKKYGLSLPSLLVCGSCGEDQENDVLNPLWTPLYKYASSMAVCEYNPTVIKNELLGMYQEITKNYEPIKKLRETLEANRKERNDRAGFFF